MAEIEPDSSGVGLRCGIVRSRFNERIGVAMLEACRKRLGELRVTALTVISVPGALEAPLALQKLANTEKYDALIALGAVIRGETHHFDVVANESASGLMQVQLDSGIPVANGILTTDTEEQAKARAARPVRVAACGRQRGGAAIPARGVKRLRQGRRQVFRAAPAGHNRGCRGARTPDRAPARSQVEGTLAGGARHPAARGVRAEKRDRYPLQGGDQRGDRARQGLRRHRRPQVRERRARQARPRTEAAREKSLKAWPLSSTSSANTSPGKRRRRSWGWATTARFSGPTPACCSPFRPTCSRPESISSRAPSRGSSGTRRWRSTSRISPRWAQARAGPRSRLRCPRRTRSGSPRSRKGSSGSLTAGKPSSSAGTRPEDPSRSRSP